VPSSQLAVAVCACNGNVLRSLKHIDQSIGTTRATNLLTMTDLPCMTWSQSSSELRKIDEISALLLVSGVKTL